MNKDVIIKKLKGKLSTCPICGSSEFVVIDCDSSDVKCCGCGEFLLEDSNGFCIDISFNDGIKTAIEIMQEDGEVSKGINREDILNDLMDNIESSFPYIPDDSKETLVTLVSTVVDYLCNRIDSLISERDYLKSEVEELENDNKKLNSDYCDIYKEMEGIKYRQLIRIVSVNKEKGYCHVIVPGWDLDVEILLELKDIPEEIRDEIEPGQRYHVRVNIGASQIEDLMFSGWEINNV